VLWRLDGPTFVMEIPEVATYRVRDSVITVQPEPGGQGSPLDSFARATPQAVAFFQQGVLATHAATVLAPAEWFNSGDEPRAIVIAGDSGSGKSAIAAALVDVGGELIHDDLTPVDISPNRRVVVLAPDSGSIPIGAIFTVHLAPGHNQATCIRRQGVEAFESMTRMVYQSHVAEAVLGPAAVLRIASTILGKIHVFGLERPRGTEPALLTGLIAAALMEPAHA